MSPFSHYFILDRLLKHGTNLEARVQINHDDNN